MKLGVETPDRVVDINRLGLDGIERRPMAASASAPPLATPTSRTIRSSRATMPRCRRPSSPAPRRSCATPRRPRATCCSARAASISATRRRLATSGSPGAAARRSAARTACSPILGTSEHCIATNPSDMAVAMLAYDAVIHVQGAAGERQVPIAEFYLLPGDTPRPGERPRARRSRDPRHASSCRVRGARSLPQAPGPRLLRVRARLGRGVGGDGGGPDRRARSPLAASAPSPGALPAAEAALVGQAPDEALSAGREIALSGARPQSQNGFKIELARRCLVHALRQVTA